MTNKAKNRLSLARQLCTIIDDFEFEFEAKEKNEKRSREKKKCESIMPMIVYYA